MKKQSESQSQQLLGKQQNEAQSHSSRNEIEELEDEDQSDFQQQVSFEDITELEKEEKIMKNAQQQNQNVIRKIVFGNAKEQKNQQLNQRRLNSDNVRNVIEQQQVRDQFNKQNIVLNKQLSIDELRRNYLAKEKINSINMKKTNEIKYYNEYQENKGNQEEKQIIDEDSSEYFDQKELQDEEETNKYKVDKYKKRSKMNESYEEEEVKGKERKVQYQFVQNASNKKNKSSVNRKNQDQKVNAEEEIIEGNELITNFLKKNQELKYQQYKNNKVFHNTLNFGQKMSKNSGGGGNLMSSTYQIDHYMPKGSEIIKQKQQEYSIPTPHHLRLTAIKAKEVIKNEHKQQKESNLKSVYGQLRDVSYRVDAQKDAQDDKQKRQFEETSQLISHLETIKSKTKKQLFEEYVQEQQQNNQQLNNKETIDQFPHYLQQLEKLIIEKNIMLANFNKDDDSKLFLTDLSNKFGVYQQDLQAQQPQSQQNTKKKEFFQNNITGESFGLKRKKKEDAILLSKHKNLIEENKKQPAASVQSNYQQYLQNNISSNQFQQSRGGGKQRGNSQQTRSTPSLTLPPTTPIQPLNIKINTKNYFLSPPQMSGASVTSPNISSLDYYESLINQQMKKFQQQELPSSNIFPQSAAHKQFSQSLNNEEQLRKALSGMLGNPSSRKDAETLQQWFRMMIEQIDQRQEEETNANEIKLKQKKLVYIATFQELARQVTVHCINRGELLKELWNGFFLDYNQAILLEQQQQKVMKEKFQQELDKLEQFYIDQLKRKQSEISKTTEQRKQIDEKLAKKQKKYEDQKNEIERWKLKCEKLLKKYTENKFKLLKAEAVKSKDGGNLGVHDQLILKKTFQENIENEKMFQKDKDLQEMFELSSKREKEGVSNKNANMMIPFLQIDKLNNKSRKNSTASAANSPRGRYAEGLQANSKSNAISTFNTNNANKKRQVGAFYSDMNELSAKKQTITLREMIDKATDTKELQQMLQVKVVEQECQTVGASYMIQNILLDRRKKQSQEQKGLNLSRNQSVMSKQSIDMLNLTDDIEKIVTVEAQKAEEEELKNQINYQNTTTTINNSNKQRREKQVIGGIIIENEYDDNDGQSEGKREQINNNKSDKRVLENQTKRRSQTLDDQFEKSKQSSSSQKKEEDQVGKLISYNFKAALLQKIIQKLKESFKVKEELIKQLLEENRDLFMQLDIEKIKFEQVVKSQNLDNNEVVQTHQKLIELQKNLEKEKKKHEYYKDLIQQVGEIEQVKEKLNISVSDVEEIKEELTLSKNKRSNKKLSTLKLNSDGIISDALHFLQKQNLKSLEYQEEREGMGQQEVPQSAKQDSSQQWIQSRGESLSLSQKNDDEWNLLEGDETLLDLSNDSLNNSRVGGKNKKSQKKTSQSKKTESYSRKFSQTHPQRQYFTKLFKKINLPKFLKIACTLKTLLKTINIFYFGMINIYKNELINMNTFTLKQTTVELVYDQFIRTCGIKALSEKRFAQTISAVMRFKDKIGRVRLFGRFLGLYDDLDKESFKLYLMCLNYMYNVSTFGYNVPLLDSDEIHYVPFIRFNDFMRTFFENKIQSDEYQELKYQIDKIKEHDIKKNRNTFILNMDKAIEILINGYLNILNQKKSSVQDLFSSFDFYQMELIEFQSFYLLISVIVEEQASKKVYTYQQIKEIFERNSESIYFESLKQTKKMLTLESFISVSFTEQLFIKETQQHFLKLVDLYDSQEIKQKMDLAQRVISQEIEVIKGRFQDKLTPYIADLIEYITISVKKSAAGEDIKRTQKQLWILIRVIQEYSKRHYLEVQTQKYMGKLDLLASLNECKQDVENSAQLLEEEKNLFHMKFQKPPSFIIQKQTQEIQINQVTNVKQQTLVVSAKEGASQSNNLKKRGSSAIKHRTSQNSLK